ncbi:MAG: tRNA (N(6)-L-threonylcarbamoyladenosine(37)-C(2))-methylthiotransferase MtaB [Candidatus Omnitrophica bacterium]|nr:tRNA (N(6)-L-threonylcarbamoyladenosine(37)-C(2))-methylthiotransferase MtaB [Candidatus Omnitrophota bacterium]
MNSPVNTHKRFFIKTLGCKVNQYESQAMREILLGSGFVEASGPENADIYILNTCTVTHEADKKSRYLIKSFHRKNPKAAIAVTGCYVTEDSGRILELPGVSYVLRNDRKGRIAEMLSGGGMGAEMAQLRITDFKGHSKAFVKVQDGCENRCSYCKVPLVRPVLGSKLIGDVVDEVRGLVSKGFREIVLTGICLGAWGSDIKVRRGAKKPSIVDMLEALERVKGEFRVRLSSIELKYVTDGLIGQIAKSNRVCKHLHIPLQSGDDKILKRMNRPYTAKGYLGLIKKIRSRIKGCAVTTDVIVGFPGEGDAHFKNTAACLRSVRPLRTHIFTFSKREGTAACRMDGAVGADVMKKRYNALCEVAGRSSHMCRKEFLNRELDVLVETKRDKVTGLLTGYSDNYIKVEFEGSDSLMGRIAAVRVKRLDGERTIGTVKNG